MSDDEDSASSVAHHALAETNLGRTQSYVERGRSLAALTEAEMKEEFVQAYCAFAHEGNDKARLRSDDISAEYMLRGLEEPYELIAAEVDIITDRAVKAFNNLSDGRKEQIERELQESYDEAKRRGN